MLIARMVGRDLTDMYPKKKSIIGEEIISVKNLKTTALKDVSFSAKKGEIFGIYGLMGSGHQEIGSAIFGQDILEGGEIFIHGKSVHIKNPTDAIAAGLAYVPAERKTEGLVLNQSVAINTMVAYYTKEKKMFIDKKHDKEVADKWI